jgi:hypothetical protein
LKKTRRGYQAGEGITGKKKKKKKNGLEIDVRGKKNIGEKKPSPGVAP